jgi:large subunit ribosomal protein L13e
VESLQLNAQRLKEYKSRLIVFPRKANNPKAGDASPEELASATQLVGTIVAPAASAPAVTFAPITEEMKAFRAHSALRSARNDAKLLGKRLTKKAAEKTADKE